MKKEVQARREMEEKGERERAKKTSREMAIVLFLRDGFLPDCSQPRRRSFNIHNKDYMLILFGYRT